MMVHEGGEIHNIHYGDILTKYQEIVSLASDSVDCLSPEGETHSVKDYVQDGDIIIADTAEDEMVGKMIEIRDIGAHKVLAGLHTVLYRPPANLFVPGWLGYWMNSDAYHTQLLQYMTGTKVLALSKASLAQTFVYFPSKEDQVKIVTALENVQKQITILQSLLAKYESIKKATVKLLMTPGDGWKKIPLGEIGEIAMCKRILKSQTSEYGEIPFYKIGTFGKTPDAFISRELFDEYKHRFSYPNKGDVLLSAAGTIGRTVVFNGENAYFQDSNIVWIANDEKIVYNSFLHMIYSQIIWQTENGGTVGRLYNANIRETVVDVPSKDEQKRIVSIIDILNNKISLLADQLKKTMNVKQAMLQYFFGD